MAKAKKSKSRSSTAKAQPKAQVDATAKIEKAAPAKPAPAKPAPAKTAPAKSGKSAKEAKKKAKKAPKKGPQKKPNIFKRFFNYIRNVRLEIKRTTWPTRNEVLNMTIIVIVALLFFGVLIFIVDQIMVVVVDAISSLKLGSNATSSVALTNIAGMKSFLSTLVGSFLTGGM